MNYTFSNNVNGPVHGTLIQIAHVAGTVTRHDCQHQDEDTAHTPETESDHDPHADCIGVHYGPGGAPIDCDDREI